MLASRQSVRQHGLSERYLGALERAVRSPDTGARDAVVAEMLRAQIGRDDICDYYIPEVARRLGRAWCEDSVSFADVTIGSARLQALLRDIGGDHAAGLHQAPQGANVAVMVLADEYHTLGAMVLTGQLRRLGVSVRLMLGRPLTEIEAVVRDSAFDAVLVSVAHREELVSVRRAVTAIRAAGAATLPVVIGGGILETGAEVCAETGANFATSDVREALRLCGLVAEAGAEQMTGDRGQRPAP
ncbi:hypothetical protein DXV76_18080 [Rhodobacteraceae bacterium CCMM004]|nr:hypothetical protein DXV76_18080 [Rhodobacteraceae bacterium CCMM004]